MSLVVNLLGSHESYKVLSSYHVITNKMSFKVVQKIKDNYYLYEAEGYWDPEKKRMKQRRTYIGKCDAEGNLIQKKTTQRSFSVSKSFGPYYLLLELAHQTKLYEKITKAHGEDADKLISLAIMRIVRPSSLRNIQDLIEESFLPEMLELDSEFYSSQNLSKFLNTIQKNINDRFSLFSSLIDDDDVLVYDITGFESLSKVNEYVEFGRKYQSTNMMQMNLGLVHSLDSNLPVYYKIFPGSIVDVSTLVNLIDEIKELGVKNSHLLIDRGFFSEMNLTSLMKNDIGFTIPGVYKNKAVSDLADKCSEIIDEPKRIHSFHDDAVGVIDSSVFIGSYRIRAVVYRDMKRQTESMSALYSRLQEFEKKYDGMLWDDELVNDLRDKKGVISLLKFINEDGKIRVRRKNTMIKDYSKRFGMMILLTTSDESWDVILARYRSRNDVEEEFRVLKSSLGGGIKYLSSRESVEGMLYVEFIALVLRTALMNKMKEAEMLKDVWIPDVMNEMNKLKIGRIGQNWRLSELTKKQKDMFQKLKIDIPDASRYLNW